MMRLCYKIENNVILLPSMIFQDFNSLWFRLKNIKSTLRIRNRASEVNLVKKNAKYIAKNAWIKARLQKFRKSRLRTKFWESELISYIIKHGFEK